MNLEEIYSSKIRQRIIEALSQNNRLPVTKLNHITGGSYSGISPHLLILEKEGIIKSEYQKLPKQPKTRTIRDSYKITFIVVNWSLKIVAKYLIKTTYINIYA
jgi:DNA-binding transcriptional ArsR family regulator